MTVWIPNANVGCSVDRSVGSGFRLRSMAGRGTELSAPVEGAAICNK